MCAQHTVLQSLFLFAANGSSWYRWLDKGMFSVCCVSSYLLAIIPLLLAVYVCVLGGALLAVVNGISKKKLLFGSSLR